VSARSLQKRAEAAEARAGRLQREAAAKHEQVEPAGRAMVTLRADLEKALEEKQAEQEAMVTVGRQQIF
jgi:hypothetical protein